MTDRDFDQLLYQRVSYLPPEPISGPWRRALGCICWGLILITVTLSVLSLQYILPAVGSLLLYLGFRPLRKAGPWLTLGYVLSIVQALYQAAVILLLATPAGPVLTAQPLSFRLGLLAYLLRTLLVFALWLGLRGVFRRAGQRPRTAAAAGVAACYVLMLLLALGETQGALPLLGFLLLFLCAVAGLFHISATLEQAGYAIPFAPVRVSTWLVSLLYLGILAVAVPLLLFHFNHVPLDASPAQAETGQAQLRQELVELGFPEEVLADLTDSEVAALEGAQEIYAARSPQEGEVSSDFRPSVTYFIQVNLPGDLARYYLWFSQSDFPEHGLRESLEVDPLTEFSQTRPGCDLQGRLLWEEGGQLYQFPLSTQLKSPSLTGSGGSTPSCSYVVDFSLPRQGKHVRGYVSYEAQLLADYTDFIEVIHVAMVYFHRPATWLDYPWKSPEQYQAAGLAHASTKYSSYQNIVRYFHTDGLYWNGV